MYHDRHPTTPQFCSRVSPADWLTEVLNTLLSPPSSHCPVYPVIWRAQSEKQSKLKWSSRKKCSTVTSLPVATEVTLSSTFYSSINSYPEQSQDLRYTTQSSFELCNSTQLWEMKYFYKLTQHDRLCRLLLDDLTDQSRLSQDRPRDEGARYEVLTSSLHQPGHSRSRLTGKCSKILEK